MSTEIGLYTEDTGGHNRGNNLTHQESSCFLLYFSAVDIHSWQFFPSLPEFFSQTGLHMDLKQKPK